MQALVQRFEMAHPGDVSALEQAIVQGRIDPYQIVCVIGKTEGNGGVNDFTRGYFTQSLMALLALHRNASAAELLLTVPCVLSGGTEGVLTPHYLVFSRDMDERLSDAPALAIGTAFGAPLPAEHVGGAQQIADMADTVRRALADARLAHPDEVVFVQAKVPCVTSARTQDALRRGRTPLSADPGRSMALSRAAGALGVGQALGEFSETPERLAAAVLSDFSIHSERASISSGVEVDRHEVIVLGCSAAWTGPLRIGSTTMQDALDLPAVVRCAGALGLQAAPQLDADAAARIAGVLVKCEPDRRGRIRGRRHTMLDDTDINAQRHIRGAVGALVAGVLGDTRLFVSGGAEHQGPDGGGLIAIIAAVAS